MSKHCKLPAKIMLVYPILLVLAVLTFYGTVAAKGSTNELSPQILINGQEMLFPDAQPFLDEKGRMQAPARFVAQELGAAVTWDDSSATACISGHGKAITLIPGQDTAEVNGSLVSLNSGAVLEQDRIYVPLRFIAETLGATVQWNEAAWTVVINMELPIIRDSGISYTKRDAGWYTIPSTFTAWVKSDNAQKVDFYLTPTGTNQEPVKIATAYSNNQEFSITYTLPGGYTMAHFWAVAVNAKGEASTGVFNVYCELDDQIFTMLPMSSLNDEQKTFFEEVKNVKGVHQQGDLYVIALGDQPNPGYGIEFVKTTLSWEQATVYVRLTKPEPGKMYAQVISYPCLVGKVKLPPYTTISFVDIDTGKYL
ncbi:MAG: stalk domain-containing protein [Desulfotomaculaceae bacterium]|nr:stalk domain-containing protein [Desulfotomaculaceae bacterium]